MADTASFERFAADSVASLHRTAWLLTHDRHAAEDLVQETYARVYVSWRKKDIDNPLAYARTTLVRQFVSGRRRRSASEVVTDTLPETAVATDPAAAIAVRQALMSLPHRDRAVLVLRYFLDLSVADAAASLGMTESAVRTRSSRAVARLRTQLGDDLTEASSTGGTHA